MALTPGVELVVNDVERAERWLCDNLFFQRIRVPGWQGAALQNGSCLLYLSAGAAAEAPPTVEGGYHTGLAHIALRAHDIQKSIQWCRGRGLVLELCGGGVFFNPRVYGDGEEYFNIISPFGVRFEVSRRVDGLGAVGEEIIAGLDHIGLPCADLDMELRWFTRHGFAPEFEPVHNVSEVDGALRCCMARKEDFVLELYELKEQKPLGAPVNAALRRLRGFAQAGVSPAGAAVSP